MIKNYISSAIRNMKKNRLVSAVNITGLVIAFASFVILFAYVWDEMTYDRMHKNGDRIYLISEYWTKYDLYTGGSPLLGSAMMSEIPGIEKYTRINKSVHFIESNGYKEKEEIAYSDAKLFEIFNFKLLYFCNSTIFNNPNSIIITEKAGKKYFPGENPLNKELMVIRNNDTLKVFVSGVMKDIPENSSLQFSMILPYENLYRTSKGFSTEKYNPYNGLTFLLLKEGVSPDEIAKKIPGIIEKHYGTEIKNAKDNVQNYSYSLDRLYDYHFSKAKIQYVILPPAKKSIPYILLMIAFGILLLACFNYINLMTANYSNRFKEIGLRKVIGAKKIDLLKQVLTESMLVLTTTFIIGMLLAGILLPYLKVLLSKNLSLSYLLNPDSIITMLLLVLIICFFCCIYPIFILSKTQVVDIIKSNGVFLKKRTFSKILLAVQFTITVVLITATLIITKQRNFIQNKNLGYDPNNILLLSGAGSWKNTDYIMNQLKSKAGVVSVSAAFRNGGGLLSDNGRGYIVLENNGLNLNVSTLNIYYDYLKTIGIKLILGRDFSREIATDVRFNAIVNESFLKAFNETNPLGKHLSQVGVIKPSNNPASEDDPIIIGVVKDFHIASLTREIKPLVITLENQVPLTNIIVKLDSESNGNNVISSAKSIWSEIFPQYSMDYSYLKDEISAEYKNEDRWNQIFGYTTILAIIIASMGVFAMCVYDLRRKQKEISIRKVLGAEIKNLYLLLSKEYLAVIIISCLLSWPIAYYYANMWLNNYAYKISVGLDTFILSLLIISILVTVTISYNVLKSARENPINTLKSD
jgi:putative ABC transport system permease protein